MILRRVADDGFTKVVWINLREVELLQSNVLTGQLVIVTHCRSGFLGSSDLRRWKTFYSPTKRNAE